MHPRSLLGLLGIAMIAAVLAAGCTVTVPQPSPPVTTVGGGGPGPTATATVPVTTAATPSAAATATPQSPTTAATSPTSPGATPSPEQTGDTGDVPSTEATTAVPTQAASPTVTATAARTVGATPTATCPATPTARATVTRTAAVTATVTATSTSPAAAMYTEPELKYLLLDHYGEDRFFFCDPDQYPVSRGDELDRALEAFPAIENDTAEFAAIVERTGLRPPYPDEAKLTVYREHKKLRAILLDRAAAGSYTYTISLGTEEEGRRASGAIRADGTVLEERSEPAVLTCPICLAAGTRIATPAGPVPVKDLRDGMSVWTVDTRGDRVAAPVLWTSRTRAPPDHEVVHLRLSDGREVTASPGHPAADGQPLGALRSGDPLDGAVVSSAKIAPYDGEYTYDLLPAGPTGRYWADGVLLGSTLR